MFTCGHFYVFLQPAVKYDDTGVYLYQFYCDTWYLHTKNLRPKPYHVAAGHAVDNVGDIITYSVWVHG